MEKQPGEMQNTNPVYELFILVLGVISVALMPVVLLLSLSEGIVRIILLVDAVICFIFFFDFFRNIFRSPKPIAYLKWGWLDLLGSIPFMPLLRLARLPRIGRAVRLLRAVGVKDSVQQFRVRRAEGALLMTSLVAILMILVVSILILRVESQVEGSNIDSGDDALWWALVTITTVGYGDQVPVSQIGRILGGIVIVVGVGFYSVLTSYLASFFLSAQNKQQEADIATVKAELVEIKRMLENLRGDHKEEE